MQSARHLFILRDACNEEIGSRVVITHGETTAEFAPKLQIICLENLRSERRGTQEFNRRAQRNACDSCAGFQRRRSLIQGKTCKFACQLDERLAFGRLRLMLRFEKIWIVLIGTHCQRSAVHGLKNRTYTTYRTYDQITVVTISRMLRW